MKEAQVLLLPGRGNAASNHWMSHWEAACPEMQRVWQQEWHTPQREDWVNTLIAVLAQRRTSAVLVAHSVAVALVNHAAVAWAQRHPTRAMPVKGALLVAPSDVESPTWPPGPIGFAPMPVQLLPFLSIVVASSNDPRVSLARAQCFATAWGARLEVPGALGHMGADSQLGMWVQARAWLEELLAAEAARVRARRAP